jgi:hypothetical protein
MVIVKIALSGSDRQLLVECGAFLSVSKRE